jgi:hypothetical protein
LSIAPRKELVVMEPTTIVGDRHAQDRRKRADAPERGGDRAEKDVGVVDDRPGRADHDHEPAEQEHREVDLQLTEEPAVDRQHEPGEQREPRAGVHGAVREAQRVQDRHEAHDDERHAEPERDRVLGADSRHGHEPAEEEADDAEDPPPPAPLLRRRVGQVPNRADDVHAADAPSGKRHDGEGHEDPDCIGDDEARRLDGVRDLKVSEGLAERCRHHEHHPVGDGHAEEDADRSREEVVGHAFEQERLDEVAATRPHRTCDSQLAAPFGGEHDEDEEDQEDPCGNRERSEGREHGHERSARRVGGLERVLLRVVGLEPERGKRRLQAVDHRSAELGAALRAARVRHEDSLHQAGLVEQALSLRERQEQAGAVRCAAVVVHDRLHRRVDELLPGEDAEGVPGLGVQLVGRVGIEIHLTGLQSGQ